MTFKEFLSLFWLNLVVKKRLLLEYLSVVLRYYGRRRFARIDLALLMHYFFDSPYRISKLFLISRGEEDPYTYGETPLTTMDLIARSFGITADDTLFELGCGRGRACFWLHSFVGCRVVGIEYIPEFVAKAKRVQERFDVKNVEFRLGDLLEADYTGATILYFYGICFDELSIKQLIQRLGRLPQGTKIITVSYPLTECSVEPLFEVTHHLSARFTWGVADVFLQELKCVH